jgi:hypothetical protein
MDPDDIEIMLLIDKLLLLIENENNNDNENINILIKKLFIFINKKD